MNKSILSGKINVSRVIQGLVTVLLCVSLFSCSKDDSGPEDEAAMEQEIGSLAGLGEQDGTPQGTPFQLPDGVTVDGLITGDYCEEAETEIGSGYYVTVCVALRNDKDQQITVKFPGGLILISETDDYQNGVVLGDTEIILQPKITTHFIFYTYCGNNHRSASSSSSVYTFGPVTNSKLITRLVNDLKTKKIAAMDYWDGEDYADEYGEVSSTVQSLLWQITDGSREMGWESFDHTYELLLNEIPNK